MQNNPLKSQTIDDIKAKARQKLIEYSKLNDVIGGQIFNILARDNKVLYYPVEDDEVWGFSEEIKGQSFVWINTAIPYDKQVFAAAHELYHLWFDSDGEMILKSNIEKIETSSTISESELKANRFASEFLINEELLLQEIKTYSIDKRSMRIKDVFALSNLFTVPYKIMANRLYETKIINEKRYGELVDLSDADLEIWLNRLGLAVHTRESKISLSNLVDLAMELFEEKKITKAKLEYLLSFAELTLKDMGIDEESEYIPPTDEELDAIMEE